MKTVFTKDAPVPIGPYSQGVIANGMLYCSGQIPIDPKTGRIVDGDVSAQTEQVCENIAAVLSAAGLGFSDVVKTTCFLADMQDFAQFNAVYERYFVSKPARSCIAAKQLPAGASVEVEVIAVL